MGVLLTDPALALVDEACLFAETRSKPEPSLFVDRPAVTPRQVTETRIVCGNCAGDGPSPRKTLLTRDGGCDCCGGRSYVLAVNLEIARRIAAALNQKTALIS